MNDNIDTTEGYLSNGGYQRQIVREALNDIKEYGSGYVFNMDQVNDVIKKNSNVIYKKVDNHYYIVKEKS